MSESEYTTDVVVVGSGGGLCGALTAATSGLETLVIEKLPMIGGATAMSGGILWLPNNPLMQAEGVQDSLEEALEYFDAVVGDVGPASSPQRRLAYLTEGSNMVRFLQERGLRFERCEGYSDYHEGQPGIRGGKARGRSIEPVVTDGRTLGDWFAKLMPGMTIALGIVVKTREASILQAVKRRPRSMAAAVRVGARTAAGRVRRQKRLANGGALVAQTLKAVLDAGVTVWTGTPLVDLIVEDGRVVGVVATRDGETVRIRARHAVLLASGGFARNPEMRKRYGKQPNDGSWTIANPGDTGEAIEVAMKLGAAVDLMDEAWWLPASVQPNGRPSMHNSERSEPGSIVVDKAGKRYFNEADSYMAAGRAMYAHNTDGGSIPSWLVIDSRHRARYLFAFRTNTPDEWLTSGYMKKADTLEELARACGIDPAGLVETVARFNSFAVQGTDPDFHRGEGGHERYQGDYGNKPNASLGPVAKPPFYAVELYPGDVGTSGGLLSDEYARVLDTNGQPIPGLYAAGNCTASVMGRSYPGAGASIGASFVFSYIGMKHAARVAAEQTVAT
ncbi:MULTISPECIES: FAD-dependent oxidoreductase [unclassified Pseudofrankia]|uniref:FAD-dependent oxidoreductase n=1 Tax=unclassified Pseudofrankia TaxID=2994372 RepID=UPI0008D98F22|nr:MULTISPECIES: FAD-dependent oxidoreductase [unclassified Pseudofrankia]MDT3445787.1 FAD-dependent oxidoreductase [Pseudofrankia sp. BMG5.37]OHV62792.1 3-ketosteroid-delta-1-dehydrogenase [Pseudofrankia sp. BMG5.36]